MDFISREETQQIADEHGYENNPKFQAALIDAYVMGFNRGMEAGQRELNQMWFQAIENFNFPKQGIA